MKRTRAILTLGAGLGVLLGLAPGFTPEARAVEIALLTAPTVTVAPNGLLTIEVAVDNASMDPVNGIVADISGLAGVANVDSGMSSGIYFTSFCTSSLCFGGIPSTSSGFFQHLDLSGGSYDEGDGIARLVSAIVFNDVTGDGSVDPGVAGVIGQHDPTDVHLVLQVVGAPGIYELLVEASWNSTVGGETLLTPLTITLNVIPEPGTALLTALGLLGLAMAGRRSDTREATS